MLPRRAASRVCWLCHSPIYIRRWQHHHVPNVPVACSCSTFCLRSLFLCFFFSLWCTVHLSVSSASQLRERHRLLSGPTCDFLCRVKPKLFAGSWGLGTITLCPKPKGSFCLQSVVVFFFQSVSAASTANITQASNSHACDLTPLAANVFPGAEPAWFREDGNFNLPYIIFPIITPFTAISLHPESREGVERLKRRASRTLCPTLIWVEQKKKKKERGGVYTLLGVYYKAAITFSLFLSFPHSPDR